MPVRSSNSFVLRWPGREEVLAAFRRWAHEQAARHPHVLRIGCFGSYARGDWGPGSDLDIVVIVARSDEPFIGRALAWDTLSLPVPADVLVYTAEEWERMQQTPFGRRIAREAIWAYG